MTRRAKQLHLPLILDEELPIHDHTHRDNTDGQTAGNGKATFQDPAFASNKKLPIHRWVPWIAGFSRDFVRDALLKYLPERGTVLDPFAGVGTTLVEAILLRHRAIGFEINPYAALACRLKVSAHQVDSTQFQQEIERFGSFYHTALESRYTPISSPPETFKTRTAFYNPQVLHKVLITRDFINTLRQGLLRDLFQLAFASTMVTYSNYSYEPSLGRRTCADRPEIQDFAVDAAMVNRLSDMLEDVLWLQSQLQNGPGEAQVVQASYLDYAQYMDANSVDVILTSPPYLNNYHYNRNTRPQLYWLGYVQCPEDMKPLEYANFGKYWQTVRTEACVALDFALPGSDIAERLEALRQRNGERGIYGGNGWANYAASYFNDCYKLMTCINTVLQPGGTALIVIGNSILQGLLIPTDRYIGAIGEAVGLELVQIKIPRLMRIGNSIIQSSARVAKAEKSDQLYETVVELRKRGGRGEAMNRGLHEECRSIFHHTLQCG